LEITQTQKELKMPNTLKELVESYLELKAQIEVLEAQKKQIATQFKTGLQAFGIDVVQVPANDLTYQLKLTSRETHSCQWAAFKGVHPELYAEFVTDGQSTYVDVRPVNNPS
jgi:predicted phage-related endonuclease